MTDESVTVIIRYTARNGRSAEAAHALAELIHVVVVEENDCLGITMHQEQERPEQILLVEEWTNREAYTGPHMETPYIKQFIARAADLYTGPPEITFWVRTAEELPE